MKSAKADNPGGTPPRQSSINHWIGNWRSRQLLFQRIYHCRKFRNADPSAAAVAQDFMPRLGATWYAGLWLVHKITKPLANFRRWCQKTLLPRPAVTSQHNPENPPRGRSEGAPMTLEDRLAPGQSFAQDSTSAASSDFQSHPPDPISVGSGPASSGSAGAPLVSVVIPSYNQAQFLSEAVDSIVAQTFADWEIIIVNDGSPDHTADVARAVISKYPQHRIRLLEKTNGGLADARNFGIQTARGAYILPLDADDKVEPAMLQKTVALLENHPEIAIAYTDVTHFGAATRTIQAAEYDFAALCENNQLNYCSLYRREAWEEAGGYNPNMVWGYEDWDFWISCGERGFRARRIPEPLLLYRVKQSSMYTTAVEHDLQLRARIVMNHPALYDPIRRRQAQTVLAQTHFPAPSGAPRVSVIVPTCNRPEMLREALASILRQTLRDFEIIVVNDGGPDVEPVLRSFNPEQRITCLRHPRPKGPSAARNTGLRFARGQFIAYLDDDDIFYPHHLETLVNFAESGKHPVVYSDACCATQAKKNGQYIVTDRHVRFSSDFDPDWLLVQNHLPMLCVLHERRCLETAGAFDETLITHEDWDLWIRMSRHHPFVHLKEVTCEFRLRADGSSATSSKRADFLKTLRLIYRRYQGYTAGKTDVVLAQSAALLDLARSIQRDSETPHFCSGGLRPPTCVRQ